MIDCIIFSKNRACQLDLLLRSIRLYTKCLQLKVIYTFSDSFFQAGYEKLKQKFTEVEWILEQGQFKQEVIKNIVQLHVMFLVDDVVFIDNFSEESNEFEEFKHSNEILTLSLRLSPKISYCYAFDSSSSIPNFVGRKWSWKNAQGDWGYPMSLDGNIFRSNDIRSIDKLPFTCPNEFEGMLGWLDTVNEKPFVICFQQQKVVGMPLNKVQNSIPNRSMEISVDFLNKQFLDGKYISLDILKQMSGKNTVHVEPINIIFEKE
jgi:hypothetical protein